MNVEKVVLFGNSNFSIPGLQVLINKGLCAGIVIPEFQHSANQMMQQYAAHYNIPILITGRKDFGIKLGTFLSQVSADVALVMTFPFKIPGECLKIPKHGFYNVHPAILPKYRGADPIFWQVRNAEATGGISVHKMTEKIDEGPLLFVVDVSIESDENYGMHFMKLQSAGAGVVEQWTSLEPHEMEQQLVEQFNDGNEVRNWPKPHAEDLRIHWSQFSGHEVQSLVLATNPRYQGAVTYLGQIEVRVLETNTVDVEGIVLTPGAWVNSIQSKEPIIQCAQNSFIQLKAVMLEEGVMSGERFYDYVRTMKIPAYQLIFS